MVGQGSVCLGKGRNLMAIKIIDEGEVRVTADELTRYEEEYKKAYAYYAGIPPSLESFIRRRQKEEKVAGY
jgi:hypothetical protein